MKMMRFFMVLAALSGIFCSCSEESLSLADLKDRKVDMGIIDTLSYRFVALETNNESVLGEICQIMFDKDYIFIVSRTEFEEHFVLIFDQTGNFVTKIHNAGRGPGEYNRHIEIDLDRENSILLIYNQGGDKLLRFNYDGSFHSELSFPSYMGSNFCFLDSNRFAFHLGLGEEFDYYIVVRDSTGHIIEKHNSINPLYSDMIQGILYTFFSKTSGGSSYYIPIWSDKMYRLSKDGLIQVVDFGLADVMIRTGEDKRKRLLCEANKYSYIPRYFVNEEEQYIGELSYNCKVYFIFGNIRSGKIEAGELALDDEKTNRTYSLAVSWVIGHYQGYFVSKLEGYQFKASGRPELADRPITDNPVLLFFKIKI